MKKYLLVLVVCVSIFDVRAQQDPLYAQYFNNPLLINPAVAGSTERLFAGLSYRSQWSGLEGSPTTFNFNTHMSVVDNKVGIGAIATVDKVGEYKTSWYGAAFSYRIKLPHAVFSFGMQFGLAQVETNLNGIQIFSPDPLFMPYSAKKFNTGAGLLLKGDRYTLGLSAPHLLPGPVGLRDGAQNPRDQNYYFFGSYLFNLSERIELRPSTLLRMTKGTPVSADVNMNFTFDRLYTAGLFARSLNTYGVLVQMVVQNLRFGYVFEVPGKSSSLHFNTHEISLAVSLDVLREHDHAVVKF